MITNDEIKEKFPKAWVLLQAFLINKVADVFSTSSLIYFLDTHKLFIGITTDSGEDYIIELNGIIVNALGSRLEAEDFALRQMFSILEREL